MIHHRRIHGKQQRTRLDYFQRTISKASKRNENPAPAKSFEVPAEEPGHPLPQTRPDSPTARALLCEQISNAIGVRVLRIVKIDGQEPTYRLELEATKIGFPSVDKLVGQQSFRMKIASAVDHLVPRIPPKVWDRVAQMILNALTVEDGGDEANLVGAAKLYVERYLAETPFIDAEEDHPYQTRFKPDSLRRTGRDLLARPATTHQQGVGRESRDQRGDCDAFGPRRIEHQAQADAVAGPKPVAAAIK